MTIYVIKNSDLAFTTLKDAKEFQKFCNNNEDFGYVDDLDIQEVNLTTFRDFKKSIDICH